MAINDLTSDMLTRIRNAVRNHQPAVLCLDNKLNRGVAQVLQDEGYINGYEPTERGPERLLNVKLKYGPRGEQVINAIKRQSKPGRRVYGGVQALPRPMQGLGIAIVSTSKGVLSDRRCREENVGGEVVAIVM